MPDSQNKWELYESKIAELFEYHFGEHFEAFSITSLESPGTTEIQAEEKQTQTTNLKKVITTATKETDTWKNDKQVEFSGFESRPIPKLLVPAGHAAIESYRERTRFIYTNKNGVNAICVPEDTKSVMAFKLSKSATVLQRYVGSYIAAVIELLVDTFWGFKKTPQPTVQADVLNLEWKCLDGNSPAFFTGLGQDFIHFIKSGLPEGARDMTWADKEKSGSQRRYRVSGPFMDFTITPNSKVIQDQLTLRKGEETVVVVHQRYRIMSIFVEIKVLTAADNTLSSHTKLAVQNIQPLPGSLGMPFQPSETEISTCFCLSHAANSAVASTVTTLAVQGGPNTAKEVSPRTTRFVPFVQHDSIEHFIIDESDGKKEVTLTHNQNGTFKIARDSDTDDSVPDSTEWTCTEPVLIK